MRFVLRLWAWWASGRWGYGVGMNIDAPAYPPYEEYFLRTEASFALFFLFFGQVGKRLLWYEVDAYGQQNPLPTLQFIY